MARKAALYACSSKDHGDISVEAQWRALRKFAEENGDSIVAEFADRLKTAETEDRPVFREMISEAMSETSRFEVLYCCDTRRFSRRQHHAQMYQHFLKGKGVELVFLKVTKKESMLEPVIVGLMETFKEFHALTRKMEGARGMRENLAQGWRAGGKATTGYKLEKEVVGTRRGSPLTKSRLVRDPETFAEVQRYLKGRARGESRPALQAQMKIEMQYSTLSYIEQNALTYAGHTVWNRHKECADGSYVRDGTGRFRDRSEWQIKRNTHEAMITDAEAEAILNGLEEKKRSGTRYRNSNYLLQSLLVCRCGSRINGAGGYYRCEARCSVPSVKKERLEAAFLDAVFEQVFTPDFLASLNKEVDALLEEEAPEAAREVARLRREIAEIDRKAKESSSVQTEAGQQLSLIERADLLEEERAALAARLEALQAAGDVDVVRITGDEIRGFADQWRVPLEDANIEKRRVILRNLVEKATFNGKVLELVPKAFQENFSA